MPDYYCPRCNYHSKIKTHMMNHFKRKKPCKILFEDKTIKECINLLQKKKFSKGKKKIKISSKKLFKCKNCNKSFTRKFNMLRHQEKCIIDKEECIETSLIVHKSKGSMYTQSEVDVLMKNVEDEYNKKVIIQDTVINELRKQVGLLMQNQGSNITYNTNIMLNAFGNENTSYIDQQFINQLIQTGPINSISKLLKHLHFNPEHTENHNIKIMDKTSRYAKVFNGCGWENTNKIKTIDNMTVKAYSLINKHYNGSNKYMNLFRENFEKDEPTLNNRVRKDTEKMILENQNIIH